MAYTTTETYLNGPTTDTILSTKDMSVKYGDQTAIFDCNIAFPKNKITALIGPSGSGKSTFLRSLNRMNDDIATVTGMIAYGGLNINDPKINVYKLREHIGMLFQQPASFARSIYFNLTFAVKEKHLGSKGSIDTQIKQTLVDVDLWDEVKDDLHKNALALSGGQQQRLCLARTLMLQPDILLLDEPASALDPISTAIIEENLRQLSQKYTIIIVTHNLEQASRLSDYTAFFYSGHLIEYDQTKQIFLKPHLQITEDYISGDFG